DEARSLLEYAMAPVERQASVLPDCLRVPATKDELEALALLCEAFLLAHLDHDHARDGLTQHAFELAEFSSLAKEFPDSLERLRARGRNAKRSVCTPGWWKRCFPNTAAARQNLSEQFGGELPSSVAELLSRIDAQKTIRSLELVAHTYI